MPSRGMGAIRPSKMPGKKVIHRTDDPDSVDVYKKGGKVSSASKRADGIASRGKTRGKMV